MVFLSGKISVHRLFIYVLHWRSNYQDGDWVGIQLSRGEGWDPINPFNPATCLCLSEAKTWISNVICCGLFLCSVSSVKMRGATCIYIVRFFYIGNGWPSLFKLSFQNYFFHLTEVGFFFILNWLWQVFQVVF